MLLVIIIGLLIGIAALSVVVMYYMAMVMLGIVAIVYAATFAGLDNILGADQLAYSILGTMILGTAILWALARITVFSEGKQHTIEKTCTNETLNDRCPCGSGKQFKNCHGIEHVQIPTQTYELPTQRRRVYLCPCGSGKEYSNCHGPSRQQLPG